MQSTQILISQLSPYLFWDIDKNDFDAERNSAQLIQRVLEYGELDDWRKVRDFYGLDRIASDCKRLRTLPPKALSFVCTVHRHPQRRLPMLRLQTILPDTLELLKTLASQPEMQGMRLVGGTSLAL